MIDPVDMISAPVCAYSLMFSRVIPPDTSKRTRRLRSKRVEVAEVISPDAPEIVDAVTVPHTKEDGTPKALKKDGTPDRRGGTQPGAGRKPMKTHLTNYHKAINMLDLLLVDILI